MEVLAVVPGLHEGEYVAPVRGMLRTGMGGAVGVVGMLCLEGLEEALHWRVVEGFAFAAHAGAGADAGQRRPVGGRRTLRSAVRRVKFRWRTTVTT